MLRDAVERSSPAFRAEQRGSCPPARRAERASKHSYIALFSNWSQREQEQQGVAELARRLGAPAPWPDSNHFSADLGPFRMVWERHTEFARYTFIAPSAGDDPFAEPAISHLPAKWIETRPGEIIVAAHAALIPGDHPLDPDDVSARLFQGNALVGSAVSGGAGLAFTDFRVRSDGFSQILVQDRSMTRLEVGRVVQRLLEIDTYRMLALLALPISHELAPFLSERERDLAQITDAHPCEGSRRACASRSADAIGGRDRQP